VNPKKTPLTEKDQLLGMLKEMKKESKDLLDYLWSLEEIRKNKDFINIMNNKITNMLDPVIDNLYWYQKIGWKTFLSNRERIEQQEKEERIQKEKDRFIKWIENFVKMDHFYFTFHRKLDEEKFCKILLANSDHKFKNKAVLEIGCRDGRWLRKFQTLGVLPENLVGIDFYSSIIDHAKKLSVPDIQFLKEFPNELPFEDQKFDVVLMFGILMHVLDGSLRTKIGQELLRVVSDDGMIITTNFTKESLTKIDPYFSFTSIGLSMEELQEIFPNCSIQFEQLSSYGLAVIKKMKDLSTNE
jgi:ubiquinone/menaquinone biosynthesis C-methylase UbiE